MQYIQIFDPVSHSVNASAALAVLPLFILFLLLGVLRMQARWAAMISLAISMIIAIAVYNMPATITFSGATEGAAIGFFPIIWIGINAIWLFKLTQKSGYADVLSRSLTRLNADQRVQSVLIAFCFGALLEALAGGGAPVAICAVLLISIGIDPIKAAAACLIADTSPVAFGALGLPVTVLAKITSLPVHDLSVMVGRQTIFSLFIPLILIFIIDGRRGIKEIWPLAIVAGISFTVMQIVSSMFLPVELVGAAAALVCAGSSVMFLKIWKPAVMRGHEVDTHTLSSKQDLLQDIVRAFIPYAAVILVVILTQTGWIRNVMGAVTSTFTWPGLNIIDPEGHAVSATHAKFEWLLSAGSIVLIAGLLVAPVLKVKFTVVAGLYIKNLYELRWAIFTVCCVVGLSYVMNLSGQIVTLGLWAANAGSFFAPVSPVLGWFATALTGSDTSANALFGLLQLTTAQHTGLPGVLLAAANTSGGVIGKALSPQNLSVGAVAVGMMGKEGILFRQVFIWTLIMIICLSILVWLQSTPLLNWMIP
ncbi:lactate transporter [Salmonella enterica subsp. enterica]|uniref:L-lactate permease n=1 Tax=Salmonella enterica I TaxID=59201 RepID=A0A7Z1TGR6_SALET|nr:L-lactate permease [Salmonella enterica]PUF27040.1 lactate transporter [Salmonella enterica subsp. enterica]PUF51286.1 lactate transporter [Salmonella enterica subsp. enterica]